jgi:oligopeptide/dipeptide ABC transporter ATP-binding protein
MTSPALLDVKNLQVTFPSEGGPLPALGGVSFAVGEGEAVCLVGESGCGKSMAALAVMGLLPSAGKVAGGEILLLGRDLLRCSAAQMRAIRGKDAAMVFQEPMTSLNPVFTVGFQIAEAVHAHEKVSKKEALDRAVHLLETVAVPDARQRLDDYPHQLSGGLRQRVMIAMALACGPKLLLADEPTTALDVTVQAQFLDLLRRLQSEMHLGVLLITHDLGVVAEFASRVYVMYCGKVVEAAPVSKLFGEPLHPYTQGLMKSVPRLSVEKSRRLPSIEGTVPDLRHLPAGCAFAPRCPDAREACAVPPPVVAMGDGRAVRCVLYEGERGAGSGE